MQSHQNPSQIYLKRIGKFLTKICLFISEFENTNWIEIIDVNKEELNLSLNHYLCSINLLLEKHAPLKRLNKQELKFHQEPWITQGLHISIKKKNTLFFR